MLAELLGGGQTSHLYRTLVLDSGRAVNAGAWYMGSAIDETRFSVYAVPAEGITPAELEPNLDRAISSCIASVSDDAIERAKTRLVAETVYSLDSQSSLARIYGSALALGETLDDVRLWPDNIRAVTRDQLADVAGRFLVARRSTTGYLLKDTSC